MPATAAHGPPPGSRPATSVGRVGRTWLAVVAVAFVCIAMAAVWWLTVANAATEVVVETAAMGPVTRVLAVNGNIAALVSVQIRPSVTATVLSLAVAEGDRVAAGDVLAVLDASQQEAFVRQARSALEQGVIQQAQAAATYGRDRDLGALVARTKLEEAKLALDGAAQEVARLTALVDQATIQLAKHTLRAPISGTVITRTVDPGQLVDPAGAMFTLADLSKLVVEADVDEAYATQIALGQKATVQLVGTRDTLDGSVTFVAPRVDPATGGLAVKIGFSRPLAAPVGLTVTANIVVDTRDALTVPRTAMLGDAVFRLIGGKAVLTPVSVIDWPAARLIVTRGIAAGDRVIADSTGIVDGLAVTEAATP